MNRVSQSLADSAIEGLAHPGTLPPAVAALWRGRLGEGELSSDGLKYLPAHTLQVLDGKECRNDGYV